MTSSRLASHRTAPSSHLGNYITEFGVIKSLFDAAEEDARLVMHNVPVIEDGVLTWPTKNGLTDAEASQTGKVPLEDKKRGLPGLLRQRRSHRSRLPHQAAA